MKRDKVTIYKSGKFCNAFDDDGIILHKLVKYRFIEYKNSVGFPYSSLNKVKVALEDEKISYEIKDKDEVIEKYKGINDNYYKILKKALEEFDIEKRLSRLQKKIDNFSLDDLEKIIGGIEDATR